MPSPYPYREDTDPMDWDEWEDWEDFPGDEDDPYGFKDDKEYEED